MLPPYGVGSLPFKLLRTIPGTSIGIFYDWGRPRTFTAIKLAPFTFPLPPDAAFLTRRNWHFRRSTTYSLQHHLAAFGD